MRSYQLEFVTNLIVSIALLASVQVSANVYRWIDEQGKVHFSDRATADTAERIDSYSLSNWHKIKSVYDGDTLTLDTGQRVRLTGINTPEIESRYRRGEPGGEVARLWLKQRLSDGRFKVVTGKEKHDRYGRLLANLFDKNGQHINLELVENGYASVNLIPPNIKFAEPLLSAQANAESQKAGIWGLNAYQPRDVAQAIEARSSGWQRVVGKPVAIQTGRRYVYIKFQERFMIQIPIDYLPLFPPMNSLLGTTLEARGWIVKKSNDFVISVRHPSAIKILTKL